MKNLLIISTHSFVDLITNSSSELFVCDTQKSLNTIKLILQKLLDNHNEITNEVYSFDNVFGAIFVSDYDFYWYKIPEEVREFYEKYNGVHFETKYKHFSPKEEDAEINVLENKDREIRERMRPDENLYETNREEYDNLYKEMRKEIDVLWTPFGAKVLESKRDVFIEFLKQNGFCNNIIEKSKKALDENIRIHIEKMGGEYAYLDFLDLLPEGSTESLIKAYEFFLNLENWGITTKKGDIFVHSAGDNTIPYELLDTISSYLNANRYHLG